MHEQYKLLPINLQLFSEDDDDNNPLSNFDEFVGDDEELETSDVDEQEEEYEEQEEQELEEVYEEEEEQKPIKKPKPKVKDVQPEAKKTLTKQEYALVQEKRKNKDLRDMMTQLMDEVKALKESDHERTVERTRTKYIQQYVDEGYDETSAEKLADKDLRIDGISTEISSLKKMFDDLQKGNQSTFDTKTQAEQAMLYKQAKAKQSKVDTLSNTSSAEGIKLTAEQKKDWENFKKAPWGQGKSLKEFIKLHKETFG